MMNLWGNMGFKSNWAKARITAFFKIPDFKVGVSAKQKIMPQLVAQFPRRHNVKVYIFWFALLNLFNWKGKEIWSWVEKQPYLNHLPRPSWPVESGFYSIGLGRGIGKLLPRVLTQVWRLFSFGLNPVPFVENPRLKSRGKCQTGK